LPSNEIGYHGKAAQLLG